MPASTTETPSDVERSPPEAPRAREETAATVDDVGSAMSATAKGGLAAKFALARIGWRLARRYPLAAVVVAVAGVALLVATRQSRRRASEYLEP
jgi:hypothetical protein